MAKRINKGERLAGIDAASWNEFCDAADQVRRTRTQPDGRPNSQASLPNAITVEVENDSGADWTADFPIVRLTDPPILPADYAATIYQGVKLKADDPDSSNTHWGVAQGPIVDGGFGMAVVSGLTWCKVNVTDANHTTCGPTSAEATKLTSGNEGATIVYKPSGTGDLDCIVSLNGVTNPNADELRAEVSSYAAIGASGNTYGIITLKTSSPAPTPLPTGTPAISGTVYVADVYGLGSSYFTTGKVIRAIRNVQVDTYSSTDVNWEHSDPTGDGVTPFVCMVIASLTAPTWDNANKRLTPAANTNTCKLLGWDSGNSRYDEATAGTTFSPDWIGPAVTISSSKALKGWGVYHDGRYKLRTVDCSDNEVDYT